MPCSRPPQALEAVVATSGSGEVPRSMATRRINSALSTVTNDRYEMDVSRNVDEDALSVAASHPPRLTPETVNTATANASTQTRAGFGTYTLTSVRTHSHRYVHTHSRTH